MSSRTSHDPARPRPPAPLPRDNVERVAELACRLQNTIQLGDRDAAGEIATQLAKQRAPVTVKPCPTHNIRDPVKVKVHIEDQDTTGGHVITYVFSTMSVSLLKQKIFESLGFPPEIQRWVIGRRLAQDTDQLCDLMEVTAGSSLYLYLMSTQAVGLTRQESGKNTNSMMPGAEQNPGSSIQSQQEEPWTCVRCTFAQNQPSSPICELCDQHRCHTFAFPDS